MNLLILIEKIIFYTFLGYKYFSRNEEDYVPFKGIMITKHIRISYSYSPSLLSYETRYVSHELERDIVIAINSLLKFRFQYSKAKIDLTGHQLSRILHVFS